MFKRVIETLYFLLAVVSDASHYRSLNFELRKLCNYANGRMFFFAWKELDMQNIWSDYLKVFHNLYIVYSRVCFESSYIGPRPRVTVDSFLVHWQIAEIISRMKCVGQLSLLFPRLRASFTILQKETRTWRAARDFAKYYVNGSNELEKLETKQASPYLIAT